jgi:phage baseplate assembly protein W
MATPTNYGVDLVLKNGDFIITPGGDIEDTVDFENMNPDTTKFPGYWQMMFSVMDRIATIKGDNIFHPQYGSSVFNLLGTPNSSKLRETLKSEIEKTLADDPRIKAVKLVDVQQSGNTVSAKAVVTLSDSSKDFEMVFPNFVIE